MAAFEIKSYIQNGSSEWSWLVVRNKFDLPHDYVPSTCESPNNRVDPKLNTEKASLDSGMETSKIKSNNINDSLSQTL